jgi:CO/xanthine dehydrogenase FAD-binding subunit
VKPVDFRYLRASTVDEAVLALADAAGEAKVIAGGQSLGPLLNMRLARPALLVDINAIPELRAIEERPEEIRIGAVYRQREAERSALVARRLPLLHAALPHVGHAQTRNRGTIVGSIVHADPAAELPLVAVCLDAVLEVVGSRGRRDVAAADLYLGYLTTDLAEDEVAVAVRIPAMDPPFGAGRGCAFVETARREGDFAIVGAAVQIDVELGTRRALDVRLGLTGVGGTPFRFREGEGLLQAAADPAAHFASIARSASAAIEPSSDIHATAEYRRAVAATLLRRALEASWVNALAAGPDRE